MFYPVIPLSPLQNIERQILSTKYTRCQICYSLRLVSQILFFFLRKSLALWPRLEFSGIISAHCNLCSPGPRGDRGWISVQVVSASQVAGITGTCHHAWLFFFLFFIFSRDRVSPCWWSWPHDPPASASQSAGITGVSHCGQPSNWVSRWFLYMVWKGSTLRL